MSARGRQWGEGEGRSKSPPPRPLHTQAYSGLGWAGSPAPVTRDCGLDQREDRGSLGGKQCVDSPEPLWPPPQPVAQPD